MQNENHAYKIFFLVLFVADTVDKISLFCEMTLKLAFFSKYVNLNNECYLFHQKSSQGQKLVVEIGKYLILHYFLNLIYDDSNSY